MKALLGRRLCDRHTHVTVSDIQGPTCLLLSVALEEKQLHHMTTHYCFSCEVTL